MSDIFRYFSEAMKRNPDEATSERLRELGLEGWEALAVLPGSLEDPSDPGMITWYFKRDASTDIGL